MKRLSKRFISLLLVIMMFVSIMPTSIFADGNEILTMTQGDVLSVTNEGYEADMYNWTSSDEAIVTLEYSTDRSSINLHANGVGEATITLSDGSSSIKAYDVVVSEKKKLDVANEKVTIMVGKKYEMEAQDPDNPLATFTYKSSKTKVATVSSTGTVSGKTAGSATITATSDDGIIGQTVVTVRVAPKYVYIPTKVKAMVNSTYQFKPTVYPKSAYNGSYTYSSSDENIATIDESGLLTAKQVGTVTIKIKSLNGKTDSCKVYIQNEPITVDLNKEEVTIMVSKSYTLKATVLEADSYQAVTWSSDHPEIASVSSSGVVTGKTSGTATITAKAKNGVSSSAVVTVKAKPTKVDVISSKNVMLTTKYQIVTNLTPVDAYDALTYKSSNTKYVKVDKNGVVTPVRVGSAYITVKSASGKYDKIKINVKSIPTKIYIMGSFTGYEMQSYKFSTSLNSSKAYNEEKVWTSSNEDVAVVDQTGTVTMLAKGEAVIRVATVNGKYDECNVTVKDLPTSMEIDADSLNVMYKKSIYLHPVFEDADAYPICTYKSSNTKYVTVTPTGRVYGKYPGSATITVTDQVGHTDTVKIVVQKVPTKLALNDSSINLNVTNEFQLLTTVNSGNYYNEKYSYTSSNKTVATVDSTGKITALTPGYTLITVKSLNGLKKTCKVYVKA